MASRRNNTDGCLTAFVFIALVYLFSAVTSAWESLERFGGPAFAWAGLVAAALVIGWGIRWLSRRGAAHRERQTERWLADAEALDSLTDMSPIEFEETVGLLLERDGFRDVTLTSASNDRGVDLVCKAPDGTKTIVQCKRYATERRVGSPAIRDLAGAKQQHRAPRAICVTTATFSGEAIVAARACGVDLIDGLQLVTMLRRRNASAPHEGRRFPRLRATLTRLRGNHRR